MCVLSRQNFLREHEIKCTTRVRSFATQFSGRTQDKLVFSKLPRKRTHTTPTFYLVFSQKILSRTYAHDSDILCCVLLENCVTKERKRLAQFIICCPRKMERKRTHTTCTFNHVFSKKIESPENAHYLYNLSCVPPENCVAKQLTRLVHVILCSLRKLRRERTHTTCTIFLLFS